MKNQVILMLKIVARSQHDSGIKSELSITFGSKTIRDMIFEIIFQ